MTVDAVTGSVRGARHRRLGEPCEDAVGWERSGPPAVLTAVVADGHGDPRCPRSGDGARLAVGCATAAAQAAAVRTDPDQDRLATELISRWRSVVDRDLAHRPPVGHGNPGEPPTNPRLLYGTTVLLAVATEVGVTVLRIGDGDAVGVDADGRAYRLLGPDPAAGCGATSSLSADDAERWVQSLTVPRADAPALVVLVTDGVADAYPDDNGLLAACRDLHDQWQPDAREHVEGSVSAWLRAAAEHSGDDASAGAVRVWPDP